MLRQSMNQPVKEGRPLLVIDFDGTLTNVDVGDALCDRFAPERWRDIDEQWLRGELTLPEAQRQMWALVRATTDELVSHAHAVGTLRTGAERVLDAAERGAIELVVASGGFSLYIDALLGARRRALVALYANDLESTPTGVRPVFQRGLQCDDYAICKAEVVRRHASTTRPVVFCGDGSSDRCAAGVADRTFAVAGGSLHRHCDEHGIACVPFDDLTEVLDAVTSAAQHA